VGIGLHHQVLINVARVAECRPLPQGAAAVFAVASFLDILRLGCETREAEVFVTRRATAERGYVVALVTVVLLVSDAMMAS
jgi:hypothetical protein